MNSLNYKQNLNYINIFSCCRESPQLYFISLIDHQNIKNQHVIESQKIIKTIHVY